LRRLVQKGRQKLAEEPVGLCRRLGASGECMGTAKLNIKIELFTVYLGRKFYFKKLLNF
jgi:hypothetical protein